MTTIATDWKPRTSSRSAAVVQHGPVGPRRSGTAGDGRWRSTSPRPRALGVAADELADVAAVLERFGEGHPRQAETVMLKAFVGLTAPEVAELLGVTTRTVERDVRFARAYLARELAR